MHPIMADSTINPQHLLGLDGLAAETITSILDRAESFLQIVKDQNAKKDAIDPKPTGRIAANVFFENSTRTRVSFTVAAKRLGIETIDLLGSTSSTSKGETALDTVRNLEAMGIDTFVIRTNKAGLPYAIAKHVRPTSRIINAGDGRHEHPTQGLLDLLTLRQSLASLQGKTVGIVGDIRNSRVARSATFGLTALGCNVTLIGPTALVPDCLANLSNGHGQVHVERDLDSAISKLDTIMMLRVQFEREAGSAISSVGEYRARYCLTRSRAAKLPEHAVVLHPGPINRGLEIESSVADDPDRSVILQQVTNGVAVRMAVLAG